MPAQHRKKRCKLCKKELSLCSINGRRVLWCTDKTCKYGPAALAKYASQAGRSLNFDKRKRP